MVINASSTNELSLEFVFNHRQTRVWSINTYITVLKPWGKTRASPPALVQTDTEQVIKTEVTIFIKNAEANSFERNYLSTLSNGI